MMLAVLSVWDCVVPYLLGRLICMNLGLEQVVSIHIMGKKVTMRNTPRILFTLWYIFLYINEFTQKSLLTRICGLFTSIGLLETHMMPTRLLEVLLVDLLLWCLQGYALLPLVLMGEVFYLNYSLLFMHFTYLCYSQSYLNILDRSISVGLWDFNRQHEWWANVLLAYLFRFCEDACSTLWCCWSKTNFWSRTSFRVSVQICHVCINWEDCDGLKDLSCTTFRVLPLNWTVGMVGILAGTVEDALITLVLLSMIFFLQEVPRLVSQLLIFQYFQVCSYQWRNFIRTSL